MPPGPSLRFDRARYGKDGPSEVIPCAFCGRALGQNRFEILNQPACEVCADRALSHVRAESRPRFLRSLGAGLLTALTGALCLLTLSTMLPAPGSRLWGAYFLALGIGWSVGKAMCTASGGVGGRRFQVTGSLMTYAAVIYPLQFALMGVHERAWWVYLLIPLRPFAFLVVGMSGMGTWQLLAAFLGIRFTWTLLKPAPTYVRRLEP